MRVFMAKSWDRVSPEQLEPQSNAGSVQTTSDYSELQRGWEKPWRFHLDARGDCKCPKLGRQTKEN